MGGWGILTGSAKWRRGACNNKGTHNRRAASGIGTRAHTHIRGRATRSKQKPNDEGGGEGEKRRGFGGQAGCAAKSKAKDGAKRQVERKRQYLKEKGGHGLKGLLL